MTLIVTGILELYLKFLASAWLAFDE